MEGRVSVFEKEPSSYLLESRLDLDEEGEEIAPIARFAAGVLRLLPRGFAGDAWWVSLRGLFPGIKRLNLFSYANKPRQLDSDL